MRRVWIVARWEFIAAVTRTSFIVMAVGLPLFHLGLAGVMGLSLQTAVRERSAVKPILVVDSRAVLRDGPAEGDTVVRDEARALSELRDGRAEAVFVMDDDYLKSGRLRAYAARRPGLLRFSDALNRRERAAAVIRRSLVPPSMPEAARGRLLSPVTEVARFHLAPDGGAVPVPASPLAALGGVFGVCFLLGLSIFMCSGLLQQAMVTERQNRMLEVLLVSVSPLTLLAGKVAGLAAAGIVQIAAYLALTIALAPAALGLFEIPLTVILWSAACFTVGYTLFACLMAATGALGRDTQESAQIATVWMLGGAAPMFFITFISDDPGSILARALSWFPLTSANALLLRLGSGGVPAMEMVGALSVALLTAAAALVLSAALLRRVTVGQPAVMLFRSR
jgi:ABC-2 type transport system permease protein